MRTSETVVPNAAIFRNAVAAGSGRCALDWNPVNLKTWDPGSRRGPAEGVGGSVLASRHRPAPRARRAGERALDYGAA